MKVLLKKCHFRNSSHICQTKLSKALLHIGFVIICVATSVGLLRLKWNCKYPKINIALFKFLFVLEILNFVVDFRCLWRSRHNVYSNLSYYYYSLVFFIIFHHFTHLSIFPRFILKLFSFLVFNLVFLRSEFSSKCAWFSP